MKILEIKLVTNTKKI